MHFNYTTKDEKDRSEVTPLEDRCFPLNQDKSPKVKHWQGHTAGLGKARLFGIPIPEGTVVVDHDSYKDEAISKQELAENLGITPEALEQAYLQTTRNGGVHYAFSVPEDADIPNVADIWPCVDIRSARKGYIASGRGYTNAKGEPIGDGAIKRITHGPTLDPVSLCKRPDKQIKAINTSQVFTPLTDIKYCLDHIETDEKWLNVGMSVHQSSNGSEEAWELFNEWSAQFPGSYDYDNNRKRWDSFRIDKPGAATMGTLLHLAGMANHDLPSQSQRASDDDLVDEQSGPNLPDRAANGRALNTAENLLGVIHYQSWQARYDLMRCEAELFDIGGKSLGDPEIQRSLLVGAVQRAGVPNSAIDEHLAALCKRDSYHPVRSWLENGPSWDGVTRVREAIDTLNATDPRYARRVLRPWLVGCIAALYADRWTTKLVPVIVGAQSFKKSNWINRIANTVDGATLDCSVDPDKPDDVRRAVSAWIVEFAELESTTKHEAGSIKAFITRDVDRFRLPYARAMTEKKRQTAWIATVNGSGFLKDTTGNARFAVIDMAQAADMERLNTILGWQFNGEARKTDPEKLRQFWLEVKAMYDRGQSWHLDESTSAKATKANDAHTDKGPQYEIICDKHLARPMKHTQWFTPTSLCEYHLESKTLSARYGRALKLLAEEGKIVKRRLRSTTYEYQLPVNDEL